MNTHQSLPPIAAVSDRRRKSEQTLTERRYRAFCNRRALRCLPSLLCLLLFPPLLIVAAPQKNATPPGNPTFISDTPSVMVLRGGTCEVLLRAISPDGYDVKFEIVSQPRSGSLSVHQRISKSSVSYVYTHNGKKGISEDSFRFKAKSGPQKAWSYANVTITIEEPPPRFGSNVSALDFGSVFVGKNTTKTVHIKNAGGGLLRGQLKVSAPWSLTSTGEISLSEGERKKILITFAPLSTDTQRGSLVFDSGAKPFPEIALQGVGESRFEAPDKAAFEERVGASELRIPIKNRTAEPLPINLHCQLPLEAPDSIQLAPECSGELLLTLPAIPFAEKTALVTLSDGATTRDIRIQLPPPPSRLEWEIDGKNQLGIKSPGRVEPFSAKLHNTGSATANAVLRVEGEGIALAPNQLANLTIASGESMTVNATWNLPHTPGQFEVSLVAETDGLPPVKTSWEANVQLPPIMPTPRPPPPPPPPPPPIKLLASDISYQLEPHWNSCTAILSWQYSGPEPVEFFIVRLEVRRKNLLDTIRSRTIIPVPPSIPTPVPEIVLVPIDSKKANITKLPDGRWQGRVPGLTSGYHSIGIISKVAGKKREGFVEFPVSIGKIPQSPFVSWSMLAIVLLCAAYLLRKKIRSLFG